MKDYGFEPFEAVIALIVTQYIKSKPVSKAEIRTGLYSQIPEQLRLERSRCCGAGSPDRVTRLF